MLPQLDTSILIHAPREGTPYHDLALRLLRRLTEGRAPYALFCPSLYEFLRVVTHHRAFDPPSSVEEALEALGHFLEPPVVRSLSCANRNSSYRSMHPSRTAWSILDRHFLSLSAVSAFTLGSDWFCCR